MLKSFAGDGAKLEEIGGDVLIKVVGAGEISPLAENVSSIDIMAARQNDKDVDISCYFFLKSFSAEFSLFDFKK